MNYIIITDSNNRILGVHQSLSNLEDFIVNEGETKHSISKIDFEMLFQSYNRYSFDGVNIVEHTTPEERESLEILQPTQEEVSRAQVELQIINTLLELGVI